MYPNLIKRIRQIVRLDDREVLVLEKYLKPLHLKKKAFLLTEGDICREIYFVEKGCLRMYFVTARSAEQITQFALDGWWMTDYFSFMDQKPSDYYIQAIEKSEILAIDKFLFDALLDDLPQLEKYFRIINQRAVAAAQLRNKLTCELSKEEFYLHFCSSFPEFIQRVPQYMIASYLGLTPEYVSELRRKNL